MADPDKRDQDLLTSNAATCASRDTLARHPVATVPAGNSYRQLIPFSPFDPGLSDANHAGDGQRQAAEDVMVQQFLLMAARSNPLISILERGDSYRPLVE